MSPSPGVEALLRELGPRLRRGDRSGAGAGDEEAAPRVATGLAELDRLLGGGFARGRLSEVAGPPGSGRTSLALALLAGVTGGEDGEPAALVDAADGFDPACAGDSGVELARVLWVRPPGLRQALRSAERLLEVGGFGLLLLDLTAPGLRIAPAVWPRLARAAAPSRAALVVLSERRSAGSSAELAVEMKPPRVHFGGTPLLLEALEIRAELVRHRARPTQRSASLRLQPRAA